MSFHPNDIARRGRNAGIIVSGVIVVLLGSFFKTQVLNHSQWVMQSEDNRLRQIPIPAPRGVIYDRKGEIIAENSVAYNVSMLVKGRAELLETLDRLSELIPMSRKQREDAIKRQVRDPARPVSIFPDASFDQVAVLEEHRTDFPALIIAPTPKRVYPEGKAVWAFSGYTSEVSEEELTALVDSGYRPGQQIGKSGLERQYESVLRGREGGRFVEVDARNRIMREQGARPDLAAIPGKDLKTNIDLDLQRFVFNIFGDSLIGALVAVDPQTGAPRDAHVAGDRPQSLDRRIIAVLHGLVARGYHRPPAVEQGPDGHVSARIDLQAGDGRHRAAGQRRALGSAFSPVLHGFVLLR
jgi:penicillin-binding protein 2